MIFPLLGFNSTGIGLKDQISQVFCIKYNFKICFLIDQSEYFVEFLASISLIFIKK